MFETHPDQSRFCRLEAARQEARQKITSLLDIYTTTDDPCEREMLAHVLRVGGGYVMEVKRQRDEASAVDPEDFEVLKMLHRYALQALAALSVLPATARGLHVMASLLIDAAAFLKATIDAGLPASRQSWEAYF